MTTTSPRLPSESSRTSWASQSTPLPGPQTTLRLDAQHCANSTFCSRTIESRKSSTRGASSLLPWERTAVTSPSPPACCWRRRRRRLRRLLFRLRAFRVGATSGGFAVAAASHGELSTARASVSAITPDVCNKFSYRRSYSCTRCTIIRGCINICTCQWRDICT